MAKRYPRTERDFTVESIKVLKDVIHTHTVAGFEHVPDSIVYRRFFQLITFLQKNNLTNHILIHEQSELNDSSALRNSDLNDKGFYFLQYALGKWVDRFHKDQGDEKELRFIEKWYKSFSEKNPDLL